MGDWLRDVREGRGWTLDQVGSRSAGKSIAVRLRQIERNYHPYGLPISGTLRRVELAMWLQPGRLDTLIELATRGLALPDPFAEPIVQPLPYVQAPVPLRKTRRRAVSDYQTSPGSAVLDVPVRAS